jgi:hypothetical protein
MFGSDWHVRRAAGRAREGCQKKRLALLTLHELRHHTPA